MIRAGELIHRLQLYSPSDVRNSSGGNNVEYNDLELIVWGKVSPLQGREYFQAKQIDADVTHTIVMRYNSTGINSTWRIIREAAIYELKGVLNKDEENHTLTLVAIEKTGVLKQIAVYWEDGNLVKFENGATVFRDVNGL